MLDDLLHTGVELLDPAAELLLEGVVGPEDLQRLGGGHEGQVVAAEGAVVFARLPDVQLRLEQGQSHRQAVAGDGLGHAHDVRVDAGLFEGEEGAGAAAAGLHVVDDQQNLVAAQQIAQRLQPLHAGGIETAFSLDGLHDDGRRLVHTGARVLQDLLQPQEVRDVAVEVVVIGDFRGVGQRDAGAAALHRVAGDRERAQGHAVESIGEAQDVLAAGDLAGQLEGCLHGVGSCRAGEHDLVVQVPGLQDDPFESLQEAALGRGLHVHGVGDSVACHILHHGVAQLGVVVAVVQGAGAGEEVQVLGAALGVLVGAGGLLEGGRPVHAVAADLRLASLEDVSGHISFLQWCTKNEKSS